MKEMVSIPDAWWYWEKYGKEAIIEKGADRIFTKNQMVDAFHKEIFNLVAMRAKKKFNGMEPKEGDPEALAIVANVVKETTKKWMKVVKIFEGHPRTRGLLTADDLRMTEEEPIAVNGGVSIGEEVPEEAGDH